MKHVKIVFFLVLGFLVSACSSNDENTVSGFAKVYVDVNEFTISQEDFPGIKAVKDVASYEGVKAITLVFFNSDGSKQYESTQLQSNEATYDTFGSFSLELPCGNYTMIVIGYGSATPIVLNSKNSAEFGEEKARETFVYTKELSINNTNAVTIDATLNRISSRLSVKSTDNRPANVVAVRATLSKGGKTFNPMTGLATTDDGFSNIVTPSTAVGATTNAMTNLFLASDEETMDVKIETLDAEGNVLFSKTVTNVAFKRNRATVMTGAMYSASATGVFKVETSWLNDHNINF